MNEEFKWFKEQFQLNRQERKSILSLTVFLLALVLIESKIQVRSLHSKRGTLKSLLQETIKYESNSAKLRPLSSTPNSKNKIKAKSTNTEKKSTEVLDNPNLEIKNKITSIDPNRPKKEDLKQLGINEFAINTWFKYIERGGHFNHQEDLLKVYGLTTEEFNSVKSLLVFEKPNKRYKSEIKNKLEKLEINSASADQFKSLRGIGSVLSERIIKYRDLLGGFNHPAQIKEVYGIDDSLYSSIQNKLEIIPIYKRLNINNLSYVELSSHPYIDFKVAKIICRYKLHHGPFKDTSDLRKIKNISQEEIDKIIPYITI